jgi:hypothetical protein
MGTYVARKKCAVAVGAIGRVWMPSRPRMNLCSVKLYGREFLLRHCPQSSYYVIALNRRRRVVSQSKKVVVD